MSSKGIVIVDIDGCLTDYPNVFLSWLSEHKGISFNNLEDLKNSMSKYKYEKLKYSYRISGIKRKLPINKNAKETLEKMKNKGMKIWIATKRPNWEPVVSDTKYWLKENNIPWDNLFFIKNKKIFLKNYTGNSIKIVIDDDNDIIDFVSKDMDAHAFYFTNKKKDNNNKKITEVASWIEIRKYLDNF